MEEIPKQAFVRLYQSIIDIDNLFYIHKWDTEKEKYVIFNKKGYDIITANQIVGHLNEGTQPQITDLYAD